MSARSRSAEQDMSGLLYVTARLDAHLGRVQEARDAARRGIALSESCGDEVFLLLHLSVLGFLELSVGDPEAADRILRPLAARIASSALREPSIHGELPNAIEALVELGELEEARGFWLNWKSASAESRAPGARPAPAAAKG